MDIFYILNFIVSYFLHSNVTHLTFINCWSLREKCLLTNLTRQHRLFVEFYDLPREQQALHRHRKRADFCNNNYLQQKGLVLDFDCENILGIIEHANSTPFCFSAHYKWHIYSQINESEVQFFSISEDLNLFIDADVTYSQFSEDSGKSYDVYNNGRAKGGKVNVTLASTTTIIDRQLNVSRTNLTLRSKYGNRQLLNDLKLRMGTVIVSKEYLQSKETLIAYLESSNNTHVEPFSRLGYKYEKLLQDIFQYQIEIIVYDKWSTNGSAGGAFGPIVDGHDDISGVLYTLYPARMARAHFVIQLGEFRSVFFFRTPRNEGIAGGVFLKPFSTLVWVTILGTVLVISLLLYKIFDVEKQFEKCLQIPSYITLLLNSVAVLCQQDSHFIPRTVGGRIALITLIICSYILNQYYSSVIISSLLSTPLKTHIKTLEHLADSRINVGFEPIVYIYEFLRANTTSVRYFTNKRVNLQHPNPAQFPQVETGIRQVQLGGYAYHSEATTAVRMIEKLFTPEEICDLNEVPLRGDFPASIPVSKQSPFIELRRQKYLLMLENGLINKHRKQWMRSRVRCFSKSNFGTVGLEYIAPLIILLACGMCISVGLFALELVCNCLNRINF